MQIKPSVIAAQVTDLALDLRPTVSEGARAVGHMPPFARLADESVQLFQMGKRGNADARFAGYIEFARDDFANVVRHLSDAAGADDLARATDASRALRWALDRATGLKSYTGAAAEHAAEARELSRRLAREMPGVRSAEAPLPGGVRDALTGLHQKLDDIVQVVDRTTPVTHFRNRYFDLSPTITDDMARIGQTRPFTQIAERGRTALAEGGQGSNIERFVVHMDDARASHGRMVEALRTKDGREGVSAALREAREMRRSLQSARDMRSISGSPAGDAHWARVHSDTVIEELGKLNTTTGKAPEPLHDAIGSLRANLDSVVENVDTAHILNRW